MKPPAAARWLVNLLTPREDGPFLLRDLDSRFRELSSTEGERAARRWYWRQAFSVVPSVFSPNFGQLRRSVGMLMGEARVAARTLRRRPLYAAGVAGTLALGVTAASLTFVVVWSVWLAPLGIPESDRVVRLYEVEPTDPAAAAVAEDESTRRHQLSPNLLEDFKAHSWRTIESVSAVMTGFESEVEVGDGLVAYSGIVLSPDGFGILGIAPTKGRLPTAIEGEIVISDRFWRTAFGGAPDIVGTQLRDDEGSVEIVGVVSVPNGVPGDPDGIAILEWLDSGEENRKVRFVDAIARVRPGYAAGQASEEMSAFVAALADEHPVHRGWSVDAVPLGADLVRPFRAVLSLLLGAGAIFLVLAGVNVTGLVAADRIAGQHDRSVRIALGASRFRLLGASALEAIGIGALAGTAGLVITRLLLGPVRVMVPQDVPRIADVALTPAVALGGLLCAIGLSLVVGLGGTLVSPDMPSMVRAPNRRAAGAGARKILVVAQVALTTLLVAGGTAVLHRILQLRSVDLGFEPEGVFATSADFADPRYPSGESKWEAWRRILEGLEGRGLSAGLVANAPMAGEPIPPFAIQGEAAPEEFFYDLHLASAEYFSVMGIELLAGRAFGPSEVLSSGGVVVVSQTFVEQYYPAGTSADQAVGRAIRTVPLAGDTGAGLTILGVVESTRHAGPAADPRPEVYVPFTRYLVPAGTLLVRGERKRVTEAVSAVTARVDPDQRWTPLIPYTTHLREWFAPLRLQSAMVGVFGVLGLLMVALGLYSVMAYQVASARHEIGVRKALGARDARLLWAVLARGLLLAAGGIGLGLVAWYHLGPQFHALADGIDFASAVIPATVLLVIGGTCLLSTLVPALRAAHVDPTVTLKAD